MARARRPFPKPPSRPKRRSSGDRPGEGLRSAYNQPMVNDDEKFRRALAAGQKIAGSSRFRSLAKANDLRIAGTQRTGPPSGGVASGYKPNIADRRGKTSDSREAPKRANRREGMASPSSRPIPGSGKPLRAKNTAAYGGFKPNAKLDASQVRDLRFDTRSERAGMRLPKPPPPKRLTRRASPPLPRPASRRRPE